MKLGVLGSGSWGTALAQVALDNHIETLIWGRTPERIEEINFKKTNQLYFPNVLLHTKMKATLKMSELADCDIFLLSVPVSEVEGVCEKLNEVITKPSIIINVAKGFHPITHERVSEVIRRVVKDEYLIDVVSLIGPSHAEEVVLRQMTLLNAVCENEKVANFIQTQFSNDYFRVYRNTDVIGAEIGAAVKNVMAIASGVVQGVGQGDNARAALMTRGLAEMARFGTFFGGKSETYLGLCGVGDLIVTCTSIHSRNFQAGLKIGNDNSSSVFWKENKKTVEGIKTAKVVHEIANKYGISMPITEQVYRVLYEGQTPTESLVELMTRELKSE